MAQNRNGSEPLVVCGEKGEESYAGYGVVGKKQLGLWKKGQFGKVVWR